MNDVGGKVEAQAMLAGTGERIAECTLVFTFHEFHNARLEARQAEVMSLWLRDLNKDGNG